MHQLSFTVRRSAGVNDNWGGARGKRAAPVMMYAITEA